MNPWVIGFVLAVWIGLRFLRINSLLWLAAVGIGSFVILRYGIVPPVPASIMGMFMAIILAALYLYGTSEASRLEEIHGFLARTLANPRRLPALLAAALVLPGFTGYNAYRQASRGIQPPPSGRTIHPAPPGEIPFRGKKIDLINAVNPYRELETKEPTVFAEHVKNGRKL